jgi:hypothetical protein
MHHEPLPSEATGPEVAAAGGGTSLDNSIDAGERAATGIRSAALLAQTSPLMPGRPQQFS